MASGAWNSESLVKRCVAFLVDQAEATAGDEWDARLRSLKRAVRADESLCGCLLDCLLAAMRRADPRRRLAAVRLSDVFFGRSHRFRLLLVGELREWLALAAETDPVRRPLPPPAPDARRLKLEAVKLMQRWHDEFGEAYHELQVAWSFVRDVKALEVEAAEGASAAERRRRRAESERADRLRGRLGAATIAHFADAADDVRRCLAELANAFELLYPNFASSSELKLNDNREVASTAASKQADSELLHGRNSTSVAVSVRVDFSETPVVVSGDNEALIGAIRDCVKLARNRFIPQLSRWSNRLSAIGGASNEQLVEEMVALKGQLASRCEQFSELRLLDTVEPRVTGADQLESSDSELEDVPQSCSAELNEGRLTEGAVDGSSDCPHGNEESDMAGTSALPPAIPFGLDLKYWGAADSEITPTEVDRRDDFHRFWRPVDNHDRDEGKSAASAQTEAFRSRTIDFGGAFEPSRRRCGAPLGDGGRRCQRRDRRVCPFHGAIADEAAVAPSSSSAAAGAAAAEEESLQRDIEAATGIQLRGDERRGGRAGRGKAAPSLAARDRLQTKLFDRRTLRRVADTLDAIQKGRNERKFGQFFQYSHA